MACGGAFYMLGETEFIIAAEHATFFDPHVTYGMCAAFEPIHMRASCRSGEIMRLSLMGNYERMSAQRALPDRHGQRGRARRPARDPRPRDRGDHRVAAPRSRSRARSARSGRRARCREREAVRLGYAYVAMGTSQDSIAEGQETLRVGQARRMEAALRRGTKRVALVGAALSDIGRVDTQDAVRAPLPGRVARDRRRRPHQGRHRRPRLQRHRPPLPDRDRRVPRPAARPGSTAPASAAPRGSSWSSTRPRRSSPATPRSSCSSYGSTTRADLKARRRGSNLSFGGRGPGAVRHAVRPHADRQVRDGRPPAHARVRHDDRAARRDRGVDPLQRLAQPRGLLPRPDHDRRRADARG